MSIRNLIHRRQTQANELPVMPAGSLMARVRPKVVLVEEKYEVKQEISRNPDITLETGSSGTIKIEVPYDGHDYVSRTALDDFRRWSTSHPSPQGRDPIEDVKGGIGHLVMTGHQDTDLAEVVQATERTMALPLTIPFRSADLRTDIALVSDRFSYRHEIGYAPVPDRPKVIPVETVIEVTDPGTVKGQEIQPGDDAFSQSLRHVAFQRYLELSIVVQVYIAGRKGWNPPKPVVRKMRLSPPPGLSLALSAVQVTYEEGPDSADTQRLVQQDLAGTGLEWFDVPTTFDEVPKDDAPRIYRTPRMRVWIRQPGELFSARELIVHAEVETDGVLLSGTDVRLFDARGRRVRGPRNPLKVRSSITAETVVVLDDAFAKREFEPQQTFHFDEIIPDAVRVEDIERALRDLQFSVDREPITEPKIGKTQTLIAVLKAARGDPDDALRLWLVVLGRQQRTQRQSQHPGGRRFTSKLDTGDLTLVVFGNVPRDSRQLIHDVNALQVGLRDQFRRVQAKR